MHLHHAKYSYNGGPDGGNGGRGGHVILRGNRNMWTLLHLRYQKHVMAGNGGDGGANCLTGRKGKDEYIETANSIVNERYCALMEALGLEPDLSTKNARAETTDGQSPSPWSLPSRYVSAAGSAPARAT